MSDQEFDGLITEAAAAPVDGWDFSWLDGRATEARPPWGYARLAVERAEHARAVLDVQTGGTEVFAEILERASPHPPVVAATESWSPNAVIARANLRRFRGAVAEVGDDEPVPFADGAFDLVLSRHPVVTRWGEIARVLEPGGTYFAQHVGPGTNRELTEFFLGPQRVSDSRSAARAVAGAEASGLCVDDVREASLRVEFFDVGAVVYFLRKVIWTVPGFDVERFRDRLVELHGRIRTDGVFVSHAQRTLVEAHR